MSQEYKAGDFLVFQMESGYGVLRLLGIDKSETGTVWHLAAYSDMFLEIDMIDQALGDHSTLQVSHPHMALTSRAFESTQTARMSNLPLTQIELDPLEAWKTNPEGQVSDRSVRLLLGLR